MRLFAERYARWDTAHTLHPLCIVPNNVQASRKIYPEVPPRVEYTLTPLGETLCAPLAAIRGWAEEHIDEVTSAQTQSDARASSGAKSSLAM